MEYLKKHPRPPGADKGMDLAGKALTPRSERPRASYGSMLMSIQSITGLCSKTKRCVLKDGHSVPCWPSGG